MTFGTRGKKSEYAFLMFGISAPTLIGAVEQSRLLNRKEYKDAEEIKQDMASQCILTAPKTTSAEDCFLLLTATNIIYIFST